MNFKNHIHLILVPTAFLVIWLKDGLDAATFQIAFFVYLLIGIVISIKVLTQGGRFISESRKSFFQLFYLVSYVVYWVVEVGINRKLILLASPLVFSICLLIVVKVSKRLYFTKKHNKPL